MPIVIPAGFCQVTFEFAIPTPAGTKKAYTTCGSGDAGGSDLVDIANLWRGVCWTGHLGPDTNDNVTLLRVYAVNAASSGEVPVFDGGGRSGATSPPNVSSLIQKRTNLRGRENHGRFYWPGLLLDSEVADNGTVEGTRFTNLTASFDEIFNELVAADVQPFILHNSATAPTPITSFVYQPVIATQRRRLRRS